MKAIVYQHEDHEDLGRLGPALEAAGFKLVRRFRGVEHHTDVEAELVVVMGGHMGVNDAAEHPFLRDELSVLVTRLNAGKPCLGICLGAQLLANAAGADVFPGKNGFEVGVGPVKWMPEALKDPVIAGCQAKTPVAHWHQDTWKPVPGATLLGSTDRYSQQAFRLGPSYGFQFHPELDAAAFEKWLELGAESLAAAGKDVSQLKSQLPKLRGAEGELAGLLERLAHHFAKTAA